MADLNGSIRQIVREELEKIFGSNSNFNITSGTVLEASVGNSVRVRSVEGNVYNAGTGRPLAPGESVVIVLAGAAVGVL